MTLFEVASRDQSTAGQVYSYAMRTGSARCMADTEKFQKDPYWKDLILFYEYFHGENGAGLGASHQTGWTGVHRLPDEDRGA